MSVTIFSAPKSFADPHIAMIQRNAIGSWLSLGNPVEVLLIGDDPGIGENAERLGATHLPEVEKNTQQTPLISSIFEQAQVYAQHATLAFVNTDIILMREFLTSIEEIALQKRNFLVMGRRWDLTQDTALEFDAEWEQALRSRLKSEGSLHPPAGSDYFVFPSGQFGKLPPFALGRAGWDNWMIFRARTLRIPVIDATEAITVVHQTHDYSHLEDGLPHFHLEESRENVRLGGGPETVFTLADATWRMNGQGLVRIPWPQGGLIRWAESALVARLGSPKNLRVFRALLHPMESVRRAGTRSVQRFRRQ